MQRPTDTIDVVDPTGAIYTAIYGNLNVVVMDFEAPAVEPVATGTWSDVYYVEGSDYTVFEDTSASFSTTVSVGDLIQPDTAQPSVWLTVSSVLSNSELAVSGDKTATSAPLVPYIVTDPIWSYSSGVSTYTNNSANFEDWMLGWLFTPDVNEPCYLQVIEVTSATSIKVKGDARGLSQPDDQWRIHAPPGVDQTTGGLHTDLTEAGSRYLYGNMRYMPPQAGFDISGTIYGAQGGPNKAGHLIVVGAFDTETGIQFQESDEERIGGTVAPGRDGHDRPTRYPKLIFGCSPIIYLSWADQDVPGGVQAGIDEAVQLRTNWLWKFGVTATQGSAAATKPGKWTLKRFVATPGSSGWGGIGVETGWVAGKAIAIAVVLTWNCECKWKSYDQRIMPGDQGDNYGPDKSDPQSNEPHISKQGVASDGRCYRVFVDSVGYWTGTKGAAASSEIHHKFKGILTVTRDEKEYQAKKYWSVRIGPKDDGTVQQFGDDTYVDQSRTPPSEGEDVPPGSGG